MYPWTRKCVCRYLIQIMNSANDAIEELRCDDEDRKVIEKIKQQALKLYNKYMKGDEE